MAETNRSIWKGHLRLALVTIPVRLISAIRSDERIALHQVHRGSKTRIRYQKIAPGVGPVQNSDIISGYEVEPGSFVLLEDDELEQLKLKSRHTIELTEFVARADIDPMYFDRPYYVLPDGDVAEEGYRVIREALAETERIGIGQLTMRGRENLIGLRPLGSGLVLEMLRYASEIKAADDIFSGLSDGRLRDDLVAMAIDLVKTKSQSFDPGRYRNQYNDALRQLVEEKQQQGRVVAVNESEEEERSNVVDLVEALRRSVRGAQSSEKSAPAKPRRAAAAHGAVTSSKRKSPRKTPRR